MEYKYLTDAEIIKLKGELMSKASKLKTISDLISDEIKQDKNNDKGKNFENNIRLALKNQYNWKISDIPRHFFYRKIIYKNKEYIICPFQNIEAKKFFINFDESDYSCVIIEKGTNKEILKINDNNNNSIARIPNKDFIVESPKEIEIDGIFNIDHFNLTDFDPEEIEIIFNNTENKDYKYCIIEVKYNKNKINNLIAQLRKDKEVLEKIIIHEDILFLGFVNVNHNEDAYVDINTVGDLECLVLGIQNEIFCERNIAYPIDWKLISEFKEIKKN